MGGRSDEELRHSQRTALRARTGAHSGWRGSGERDALRLSLKTGGRVSSGADLDPLSRERMVCQRNGKLPVSGGVQVEPMPIKDMEGLGHQEPWGTFLIFCPGADR